MRAGGLKAYAMNAGGGGPGIHPESASRFTREMKEVACVGLGFRVNDLGFRLARSHTSRINLFTNMSGMDCAASP